MFIPTSTRELQRHHTSLVLQLDEHVIPRMVSAMEPLGGLDGVVLTGSRARGDYSWCSDVDLIACGDGFAAMRLHDRAAPFSGISFPVALEIICFTPEEMRAGLVKGNPMILDAMADGILMHDPKGFLDDLRTRFTKLVNEGSVKRVSIAGKRLWNVGASKPLA